MSCGGCSIPRSAKYVSSNRRLLQAPMASFGRILTSLAASLPAALRLNDRFCGTRTECVRGIVCWFLLR